MNTAAILADRVGAAIESVEAATSRVPLREIQVPLGPDRFVLMAVPADLNVAEVLGLIAFLSAGGLARVMAAATAEGQGSSIEVVRSMPQRAT